MFKWIITTIIGTIICTPFLLYLLWEIDRDLKRLAKKRREKNA